MLHQLHKLEVVTNLIKYLVMMLSSLTWQKNLMLET
jgi:hypothetical protein